MEYFNRGAYESLISGAYLSQDRVYRYTLTRIWGPQPSAMFIGLNPSTADEKKDDRTIKRCVNFAKEWGCGGIIMTNLFAFRATKPKDMKEAVDPVGPDNNNVLINVASLCSFQVACWGVHGSFNDRDKEVIKLLNKLQCLGVTKDNKPRHPLYIKGGTKLIDYCDHEYVNTEYDGLTCHKCGA